MGGTNDCIAYINKLAYIGTNYSPGKLIISASAGGYGNTNYYFDNVRDTSYYSYGWIVSNATNGVIENATPPYSITYTDIGQGDITNATNIAGYMSWGVHSDVLNAGYPTNRSVIFTGQSTWYLIGTCESFNGQIVQNYPQGNFIQWFSSNAFGGTNYSNTPIGAVTHVEEPDVTGIENSQVYFGMWAAGKNFGICAWNSRQTGYFQAVGDPFITR
jgi:hypothetical protein